VDIGDEAARALKEARIQARNQRAQELYQQNKSAASIRRNQDDPG